MQVALVDDAITIGDLRVSFHRTLRLPEDGGDHPLPPSFGRLPLEGVTTLDPLPPSWQDDDVMLPIRAREALWLGFSTRNRRPHAVQVGVGGLNAISALPWGTALADTPQNYVVCPDQPWLDGVLADDGIVHQFTAVPLGSGLSVDEQANVVTGRPGLHLRVLTLFQDDAPPREGADEHAVPQVQYGLDLGVGLGGRMRQRVYQDRRGVGAWDPRSAAEVTVHLVLAEEYENLTGRPAPPTPISAEDYTEAGLPWLELDDGDTPSLGTTAAHDRLRPLRELEDGPRGPLASPSGPAVPPEQVLRRRREDLNTPAPDRDE